LMSNATANAGIGHTDIPTSRPDGATASPSGASSHSTPSGRSGRWWSTQGCQGHDAFAEALGLTIVRSGIFVNNASMLDQRRVTGRRIVAFVIDTAVGYAVFWAMVVALGTEIDRQSGLSMTFEFGDGEAYGALIGTVYYLDGGAFAAVTVVAMAYWIGMFVVLQGLTGRTIGKLLARICTVDAAGRPCGIGRATVRWLFLVVDAFPYFVPMLVGFVVTISSRRRQRVGDLVAKTWVVSVETLGQPIPTTPPNTQRVHSPVEEMPPPNWP
jgi:uncharacterized RDD family membrane protein YckC